MKKLAFRLTLLAVLLALTVVMLGAYTRLKNAGLGCPDWPGCYGHFTVPESAAALKQAAKRYPHQPVEAVKAWAEMIHRYAAGTLGLLIAWLALQTGLQWRVHPSIQTPRLVPWVLVGLVMFQIVLGKWTVTMQLLPLVVMGHLLGGMSIFALLGLYAFQLLGQRSPLAVLPIGKTLRRLAALALCVVIVQIALGAWTSANYAALVCADFPFCQGEWIPPLAWDQAFQWHPIGVNYQGGILDETTRITIHMLHRIGALVTALVVGYFALQLIAQHEHPDGRYWGGILLFILLTQITLGILNVLLRLPLPNAVAHNAVAACLLLVLLGLNYRLHATRGSV